MHGPGIQTANLFADDPQMWLLPIESSFQAEKGDPCLIEHGPCMNRLVNMVGFDLAGMEGSPPPCQGSQLAVLSAPCSCGLLAELAGWRLQHKSCQPHHGDGESAPAWPRSAQDLHHWWDINASFHF